MSEAKRAFDQKFEKWVGLNGPRPSNEDIASYLTDQLENRENVCAVEEKVTREAIAALLAVGGARVIAAQATAYLREKDELVKALRRHVAAFKPFTMKPMGGEGSAARAEQNEQIAAHTEALVALDCVNGGAK